MKTTFLATAILAVMVSCAKKTETTDHMMNDTRPTMNSDHTMQNNEIADSTKMENNKMMKEDSMMRHDAMKNEDAMIKKDEKMMEKK